MKTEEEKQQEIRAELARITEEIEKVEKRIYQCPAREWEKLRKLCDKRQRLEAEKYRLVNLLNIIK